MIAAILASTLAVPATASDITSPNTFTFYTGRISSEETWQDVLLKPYSSNYTDSYLVTAAYSRAYRESHEGALRTEFEVNATYNFGEQDHWELNFAADHAALAALSLERAPAHLRGIRRRALLCL